ncbi:CRISPR-associated endoribonuclease Cas6 [Clostridium sardiniense]|uniref:CRISPR-associated endoribonuclease Cas6 n=1 Tax=Clostridium sardiniense TaxID=29369 RepID=A0ABS7L0G1_CLOSR|nr:CRISPR-associated endoribonuclease Cas6 [Clostridium sardiniense]MBY0756337.1 CRISPR-associated endoribonuclease Cas6 [Clostridium sardiniense]MDQ0461494.1 CRISPR-associated endoribonuclease Cas6 [Clostridium sardiniense]
MKVYEITLKLFLLKEIGFSEAQESIARLIDKSLCRDEKFLKFHNENKFKNYCFNSFYPLEKDKKYKEGNIYTVKIRTVDSELAKYLIDSLVNEYTDSIKALTGEIRIIPKKHIEKLYNITPLIIKTDEGYWKKVLSFGEFEKQIKTNLIKKYNAVTGEKLDQDFQLYTSIEFLNNKPCPISYKGKTLLGDKISLAICENEIAQKLAYMSLGTGMCTFNSRGGGFINFRYL